MSCLDGTILQHAYRLSHRLSGEGQIELYSGSDLRSDRPVVVVIAHRPSLAAAVEQRLIDRMNAQRQLVHSHIARTTDVALLEKAIICVSDFVEGPALDELAHEEGYPLLTRRIHDLLGPVAEALDYAHSQRMGHYALQPSSIVVDRSEQSESPRLVGFDLRHLIEANPQRQADPKPLHDFLYMSPERCRGDDVPDPRADIYSLGVIMYQLTTGMVPFFADEATEIINAHLHAQPTRPSELAELPKSVETILMKALAKQPKDRFTSASEMIGAFAEAASPKPAKKQSADSPQEPEPRLRRLRLQMRLSAREDWLRVCPSVGTTPEVFYPTSSPPALGTRVRLEIAFTAGPRLFLSGVVSWRRLDSNPSATAPGVGIRIDADQLDRLSYIVKWARGDADNRRRHHRLPIRLRVTYSSPSGNRINFTRDLDENGLFVYCRDTPSVGSTVRLRLATPNNQHVINLTGKVHRVVPDNERPGIGIQLHFSRETARRRYRAFIDQLEHLFLEGKLPDDALA